MGTWHYPWLPMGKENPVGGWLVQALDGGGLLRSCVSTDGGLYAGIPAKSMTIPEKLVAGMISLTSKSVRGRPSQCMIFPC